MKLRSSSALPQAKNGACVPAKRRKVEKHNIYLPREVIFSILLLVSAKFLQEVVRYVCKQWYDIVNDPCFIRSHCQMPTTTTSTSSIIQSHLKQHEVYCAEQAAAKSFKVTTIQLPFPAIIGGGSCNGLVLLCDVRDKRQLLLVMNPLTKLMFSLPPVELPTPPFYGLYSLGVNSSGQYKVVNVVIYASAAIDRWEINLFTIGVDKAWRSIDHQHLFGTPMKNRVTIRPLVTCGRLIAGFMYYASGIVSLMVMDVDTETLYKIYLPTGVTFCDPNYSHLFSMETTVGLCTRTSGIWTLRKLTDFKSREWTEISKINLSALLNRISDGKWFVYEPELRDIKPISLIDGEFSFHVGFNNKKKYSWLIRYNLANDSFVSLKVRVPFSATSWFHHVPTFKSSSK